jgi:hypothetical protein
MLKYLFYAITAIVLGIMIKLHPTVYGVPVPPSVGYCISITGVIYFGYILYNRKKIIGSIKYYQKDESIVICPNCKKTHYFRDVKESTCEDCGSNFEPMDGFYDRHPELK